jgi:hypothetical protein
LRRIVEHHLARLRQARRAPEELVILRDRFFARLYPATEAPLRAVRQERIPVDAPDWYFEAELRRSGLWEMMERCYPTPQAQAQ